MRHLILAKNSNIMYPPQMCERLVQEQPLLLVGTFYVLKFLSIDCHLPYVTSLVCGNYVSCEY